MFAAHLNLPAMKPSGGDTHSSRLSQRDEIHMYLKMYGLEKTNEMFRVMEYRDETCSPGNHLHGVLDEGKIGFACIPVCDGEIVSTPHGNGKTMEFQCVHPTAKKTSKPKRKRGARTRK